MLIVLFGFVLVSVLHARQITRTNTSQEPFQAANFGQLFHVQVQPPPAQDRSLYGQHRVDHGVFDFSLLCADGIPLLMEDHKPRPCQPRPWLQEQRCPTGFWCHEGQSEHSYYCCPSSRKFANRCHLPPAVGYGKQRMRRFYFDWKTDACHELQYSGIGGNENSFMDYEKCEQVCRGAGEPPISLPSNMKIMSKETTKEPKEGKKPEKEKKLVYPKEVAAPVSLKPPPGRTTKKDNVYEAFYTVSPKTSGSGPTITSPTTTVLSSTPTTTYLVTETEEPETVDPNPCALVPEKGFPGVMAVSMWYYDATSTTCSPFMYLGKGGNSNRFETSEECMETCAIGKPTRKSCDLPPAIGNGPFNIPRFYFDRVTKRCERFFYSGRDGNDNRFYKKNKCERLCLRKKPKKKENIFEFTTTPSMPPVVYESTPMRIIQNLVPSQTPSVPTTTQSTTEVRMNTDPYVYSTSSPSIRINPITVEPWVEVHTDSPSTLSEYASKTQTYTQTPHPTLIFEPRGETIPIIVPPSTTSPSIVDHVFQSLMNTQQQKLVELVQQPVESSTAEVEVPRKFSSHERIPFGQVEQQPVPPMSAYGSVKPTENQYGMKVEPYQTTDYMLPRYPVHGSVSGSGSIYLPQPPYPEVNSSSNSSLISSTLPPSSVPVPTASVDNSFAPASSLPSAPASGAPAPGQPQYPYVASTSAPSSQQIATSLPAPTPVSSQGSSSPQNPYIASIPPPQASQKGSFVPIVSAPAPDPSSTAQAPAPPSSSSYGPAPSPFVSDNSAQLPTHYIVGSASAPPPPQFVIPNPIPTLSPTAGPPPSSFSIYPTLPSLLPPTTTISPLPTLLPYVTSPPDNNESPCARRIYGDATIMCENRQEICPMGTFCQIGQGQSICCPIMDEPPCEQSIEEGVGASLLRRWYFDPATRLCQPFHYKGFKGNQNNFQTFETCNRACGATNVCPGGTPQMSIHTHLLSCNSEADCPYDHTCILSTPHNLCCPTASLIPAPVPPPAPLASVPAPPSPIPAPPVAQVVPDAQEPTNLVIDFIPPAPHASHNLCDQPIDVGYGEGAEHRWAYSSGQCASFLYAGQGGNMNNFLTRNDCVKTCQSPGAVAPLSSQCSHPATSGHGDQYLSRYFYSPEYRQCLFFIYSGEGGNENNFGSLAECLETCVANGVKFSSLASSPMSMVPKAPSPAPYMQPRNVCPQGDPLITVDGTPIQCDPSKAAKCPGDHVCTPVGSEAYCCPSPMNYCLQTRPPISVCSGPDFEPVREIRFTYDPMADRCVRFSFQNCRGSSFSPSSSLNNFVSNSQCNRLCCNQGYNLVYKRRLLMAMNDDPMMEDGDVEESE
ncbi:unnamed protein product [Caenorhabditis sp. 36 PRJEB53466]|nr:unnamed protein product [Caenorhabditis sp. 36 PRJEB53466]